MLGIFVTRMFMFWNKKAPEPEISWLATQPKIEIIFTLPGNLGSFKKVFTAIEASHFRVTAKDRAISYIEELPLFISPNGIDFYNRVDIKQIKLVELK
jgi:hypothetical protein